MTFEYNRIIQNLNHNKEYRPVVVTLLHKKEHDRIYFLVVQSAKALVNDGREEWLFPQEGTEENETLEATIARGLHEELGIQPSEYHIHNPPDPIFLYKIRDAPTQRADKRGFTKGKAYFHVITHYEGSEIFTPDPKEIANAVWFTPSELTTKFAQGRKEKAELLNEALCAALAQLSPARY